MSICLKNYVENKQGLAKNGKCGQKNNNSPGDPLSKFILKKKKKRFSSDTIKF